MAQPLKNSSAWKNICPSLTAKSLTQGPTSPALKPRCQIIIGPTLRKQEAPEPNMATFYEGIVGQGFPEQLASQAVRGAPRGWCAAWEVCPVCGEPHVR